MARIAPPADPGIARGCAPGTVLGLVLGIALSCAATGARAEPQDLVWLGPLGIPERTVAYAQVGTVRMEQPHSTQIDYYTRAEGPLLGYLFASGGIDCPRAPGECADARATPSVAVPTDLPDRFEVLTTAGSGALAFEAGALKAQVDAAGTDADLLALARPPFAPAADTLKPRVLNPGLGLRPGAVAQADCLDGALFCVVRISYGPDLCARFVSGGGAARVVAQAVAIDGFMRDALKPRAAPPGRGAPKVPGDDRDKPFKIPPIAPAGR